MPLRRRRAPVAGRSLQSLSTRKYGGLSDYGRCAFGSDAFRTEPPLLPPRDATRIIRLSQAGKAKGPPKRAFRLELVPRRGLEPDSQGVDYEALNERGCGYVYPCVYPCACCLEVVAVDLGSGLS